MKYSEKIAAERAFAARLTAEDAKRSTGSTGKLMDYCVRDYLMAQGVRKADDVRCRHQDKADATLYVNHKRVTFEVKTACGAVVYGKGLTKDDIVPENIYPKVTYIVYAAEVAYLNKGNFAGLFLVFTRDQFIQMLEETGKKGLLSSLKVGKKGGQIEIQPWATKACSARLNKFYDWVDDHGIPTLEEFKEGLRG